MRPLALLLLLSGAGAALCAQTAAEQTRGQAASTVGAKQIFAALTQPNRSTEMELLRGLRTTLAREGDPQALAEARAQVDAILQADSQLQGDMPPALLMSALASRIDAAVAGLEEARRAAPLSMPSRAPPWLLPGLIGCAATVAAALVACLMALTSLPPQPDAGGTGDLVTEIRRSLDEAAGGIHQAVSAARGEAADAVHAASLAVTTLGSAAQDAEARLRGSIASAEARLRDAAGATGQIEHWLAALPDRLADALAQGEAAGDARLDAIIATIAGTITATITATITDSTAALAEMATSLPATQIALQKTADGLAQADRSSARVVGELASLALRTEERVPDLIAACVRAADEAAQRRGDADALGASRPVLDAVTALGARMDSHMDHMSPDRLIEAVQAIQTRGEAAIAAAAEKLAEAAASIAETTACVPAAQQALHDATASVLQSGREQTAALVVASQVQDRQVLEMANSLKAGEEAVAKASVAAQAATAELAAATARLSEGLGAAALLPAQVESLADIARRLQDAVAAAQEDGRAQLPCVAEKLVETTARMETALHAAGLAQARTATDALAAQASQADSFASVLAALSARADASIAVLPAEASALAAASADLREDAALLGAAAERMEQANAAGTATALQAGMARTIDQLVAALRRLEDSPPQDRRFAGAAAEDAASMRDEAQRAVACMAAAEAALSTAAGIAGAATQEGAAHLAQLLAEGAASAASAERAARDFERFLGVQTGRIATILECGDRVAARLELAASQAEDAASGRMAANRSDTQAALRARDDGSAGLQNAILHVQAVAAQLESSVQAQDAALARVTQAASAVAAAAGHGQAPETGQPADKGVTLSQLNLMARQAEYLRTTTETMAEAALQGEASLLPPDIVSHTPALLATIETCIQQLRGAGTALALASDAQRKAA